MTSRYKDFKNKIFIHSQIIFLGLSANMALYHQVLIESSCIHD